MPPYNGRIILTIGNNGDGNGNNNNDNNGNNGDSSGLHAYNVIEGNPVTITATVDNAPLSDLTLTLSILDEDENPYTITIPAGSTSGSVDVATRPDEAYIQGETPFDVIVAGSEGGGYDSLDTGGASTGYTVKDNADVTTATIVAIDTKEGTDSVNFTVTLSNVPQGGDATVTITVAGTPYTRPVQVVNGVADFAVPNTNSEDVYIDRSQVVATVTAITGGNYEAVSLVTETGGPIAATAVVADTINMTTVVIAGPDAVYEGAESVTFTLTLSNDLNQDVSVYNGATATVVVENQPYTVTFNAAGTATLTVLASDLNGKLALDTVADAPVISAQVTALSSPSGHPLDFEATNLANGTVSTQVTVTNVDHRPEVSVTIVDGYAHEAALADATHTGSSAGTNVDQSGNAIEAGTVDAAASGYVTVSNAADATADAIVTVNVTGVSGAITLSKTAAVTETVFFDDNAIGTITFTWNASDNRYDFTFTLADDLGHGQDVLKDFSITANASNTFANQIFNAVPNTGTIHIVDDALTEPEPSSETVDFEVLQPKYDIAICLDLSASMLCKIGGNGIDWPQNLKQLSTGPAFAGNDHGVSYFESTPLFATIAGTLAMLDSYKEQAGEDNVTVKIVGFAKGEITIPIGVGSYQAVYASVQNILDGYTVFIDSNGNPQAKFVDSDGYKGSKIWPETATNYTAGLRGLKGIVENLINDNIDSHINDNVRVYFMSDGNPSAGSNDGTVWQNYYKDLSTTQKALIGLYPVGIAGYENDDNFANFSSTATIIRIPGNAVATEYIDLLVSTVHSAEGVLAMPHGADGALLYSVTLGKTEYVLSDTGNRTIDLNGTDGVIGSITFNKDGTWTFAPVADGAQHLGTDGKEFNFSLSYRDGDGDLVEGSFDLTFAGKESTRSTTTTAFSLSDESDVSTLASLQGLDAQGLLSDEETVYLGALAFQNHGMQSPGSEEDGLSVLARNVQFLDNKDNKVDFTALVEQGEQIFSQLDSNDSVLIEQGGQILSQLDSNDSAFIEQDEQISPQLGSHDSDSLQVGLGGGQGDGLDNDSGHDSAGEIFVLQPEELRDGYEFISNFSLGSDVLDFSEADMNMDTLLGALDSGELTVNLLDADTLRLTLSPDYVPKEDLQLDVQITEDPNGLLTSFADVDNTRLNDTAEMDAAKQLLTIMLQTG